jgi:hypothetical protein
LSTAPSAFPDDADLAVAWAHLQERLSEAQRLVVSTPVNKNPIDYAAGMRHLMVLLAVGIDAAVPPMTFSTNELEDGARAATGLDDFGSSYYREGLDRTVDALNTEAELNDLGQVIQHATISNALIQRLKIIDAYKARPEIADEVIDGPIVILGLPRTGTTALGQLISADPQFRFLRTWESQAPTPPPETATQDTDPRIAQAAEGIAMIEQMFPDFQTQINSESEAATECQDLMGMSFHTFHFDGVVRVPGYVEWLLGCEMREIYALHRDLLKLRQWHCKPSLWHLRTPVHMFTLDAFVGIYPNAKFLWSHRDPAKVLGSVCSLIAYVRSWSSDRKNLAELGAEQLTWWAEGIERAMDFTSDENSVMTASSTSPSLTCRPIQ